MNRIYVEADKTIELGKQGEYGVTEIFFPLISDTVVILHQRNKDENPYSVTCEIRGDYVVWPVTATDTAHDGGGLCEVQYYTGSTLAKSIVFRTFVHWSVADSPTVTPSADTAWVQSVTATTAQAVAARNAAAASAAAITNTIQTTGQDTIDSIPADYTALSGDVESLKRKMMAVLGGLALRDIHGASTQTYIGNSQAECPDLDNFLNDGVTYIPAAYAGKIGHHPQGETNSLQGIVVVVKTLGTKNAGIQIWIPTKYDDATIGMFFYRYLNFSNSRWRNEWFTIGASNGVNESALNWEVE